MKKLLVSILIVLILTACQFKNDEKDLNIKSDLNRLKFSKQIIESWNNLKISKNSAEVDIFEKVKKELDKEFVDIYYPEDSNHHENSCYLLLDVDYKNQRYVLYRNKWAEVGSWWCKLDGVEKIWVLWIHNGKPDPEGEYFLKSYNKETGLFKYWISDKYWNLWDWKNKYEFRFYFKDGRVIKEKLNKDILRNDYLKQLNLFLKFLKEKRCIDEDDENRISDIIESIFKLKKLWSQKQIQNCIIESEGTWKFYIKFVVWVWYSLGYEVKVTKDNIKVLYTEFWDYKLTWDVNLNDFFIINEAKTLSEVAEFQYKFLKFFRKEAFRYTWYIIETPWWDIFLDISEEEWKNLFNWKKIIKITKSNIEKLNKLERHCIHFFWESWDDKALRDELLWWEIRFYKNPYRSGYSYLVYIWKDKLLIPENAGCDYIGSYAVIWWKKIYPSLENDWKIGIPGLVNVR